MQTPTNALSEEIANHRTDAAVVPDLVDWVYKHHCIVGVLDSIQSMKQVAWLSESQPEGSGSADPTDDELVFAVELRDIIKEYYLNEQWDYVKNYLLA